MSIIDDLEESLEASKPESRLDKWLGANDGARAEFTEAIEWFAAKRHHDYGWPSFFKFIENRWPDFPVKVQALQAWCESRRPDLFP